MNKDNNRDSIRHKKPSPPAMFDQNLRDWPDLSNLGGRWHQLQQYMWCHRGAIGRLILLLTAILIGIVFIANSFRFSKEKKVRSRFSSSLILRINVIYRNQHPISTIASQRKSSAQKLNQHLISTIPSQRQSSPLKLNQHTLRAVTKKPSNSLFKIHPTLTSSNWFETATMTILALPATYTQKGKFTSSQPPDTSNPISSKSTSNSNRPTQS